MDSNSSTFIPDGMILIAGLLREPASMRPLIFTLVLLFYSMAVSGNALLIAAIFREARLHRPMFLLLANLALSDIVGCSATLPRIMHDLVAPNLISVPDCITQVMAIHFYRALECYVLTAMALDRYVAICRPLHYHTIMTNGRTGLVNVATVVLSALLVSILLILTLQLNFYNCNKTKAVTAAQCDNVQLLNFACSDGTANNVYGLILTTSTIGLSLVAVSFSYASIIYECRFRAVQRDGKAATSHQKAMQTCVTHMLVLAVFYLPVLFLVTYNRIDKYLPMPEAARQLLGGLFYLAPPALNPVIYGVRTGEIRKSMFRILLCNFKKDSVAPTEGH